MAARNAGRSCLLLAWLAGSGRPTWLHSWGLTGRRLEQLARINAECFRQCRDGSLVAPAKCSKRDIIAVFLGRQESEVVVDPATLPGVRNERLAAAAA